MTAERHRTFRYHLARCGFVLAILFAGDAVAAPHDTAVSAAHASIYDQTKYEFGGAWFLKPAEPRVPDLMFDLAPLLLQESFQTNRLSQEQPGLLILENGEVSVDIRHPAVFAQADTVRLNGRSHARFSYLWVYASTAVQGIRLTLNAAGQPAIWEVLAETSGQQQVFVSEALESAAEKEFGAPLPGRRYSIEASCLQAPNVIVPAVLSDNGVPMGPMVYLRAGTHDVTTVRCRCMPPQVKSVVQSGYYSLVPLEAEAQTSLLRLAHRQSRTPTTYWPATAGPHPRLARCLRLPKQF